MMFKVCISLYGEYFMKPFHCIISFEEYNNFIKSSTYLFTFYM